MSHIASATQPPAHLDDTGMHKPPAHLDDIGISDITSVRHKLPAHLASNQLELIVILLLGKHF